MNTYEEFMVLLTIAILIVTILTYVNHKKQPSASLVEKDGYSQLVLFTGTGSAVPVGCLVKYIITTSFCFVNCTGAK